MAISGGIPIEFDYAFPHGAYVVGPVEQVNDFDKSTRENKVPKVDKETGKRMWQVPVMDADPEARKGQHEVTVKVVADVQPVPPDALAETPFRPVVFDGMTVTPYLEERGNRTLLAYSFKATGMRAPDKPAAGKPSTAGKAA